MGAETDIPRQPGDPGRTLLVVSDIAADAQGGGAVILRSLFARHVDRPILWASLVPPAKPRVGAIEAQHLTLGQAGAKPSAADELKHMLWQSGRLAERVAAYCAERDVGGVWAVLHGATVPIMSRFMDRSAVPVHASVHDDPAFATAARSRKFFWLTRRIDRQFASVLRRARSVDVVCEPMRERYLQRYGADGVVLHRALDEPIRDAGASTTPPAELSVALLGNAYEYGQLPVLARAVQQAAGQLGVPGRVIVMGHGFGGRLAEEMKGQQGLTVEATGHVDEPTAVERLSRCFALYLNYPFEESAAVLRQTSFPTKLSTYIQAARPVIAHVPADSSVVPLVRSNGLFKHWGSMSVDEGASLLQSLWRNAPDAAALRASAGEVRRDVYDADHNRRVASELIDNLFRPAGAARGAAS